MNYRWRMPRATDPSRKHIISMKPSAVSLMPEGLLTNRWRRSRRIC
jgi:hypothetical protein